MAENAGGLNYQLNVGGDFETKLASFRAQIDALEKRSKSLGGGSGTRKASAEQSRPTKLNELEKAQQNEILSTLKKQNAEQKQAVRHAQSMVRELEKQAAARNKSITKEFDTQAAQESRRLKEQTATRAKEAKIRENISNKDAQSRNKIITQEGDAEAKRQSNFIKQQMIREATEAKAAKELQQYNDIGYQAQKRTTSLTREDSIVRAQINQRMKMTGESARKAAEEIGISSAQAKRLGFNMWDAQHAAKQFLFTFRRLVGILAIFTLARKLAQALGRGVKEMVRMNSEMETTKNAVATLISSVGRIYDSQGNLLTGQQAFTAALEESDAVVKQLQRDAIGSVSTFEALSKAFQVAVGPGLAAGLDVKQITTVTKRLVEGAVSMKVPLDQMSEEIRSILQGTATSKNTRLVSLFGGSASEVNQQIRQAKEQGRLYEFLTKKLAQVQFGALNAASSMDVLRSDLQDTASLLAKEGGITLFNALKESVIGLKNALAVANKEEGFVFNPDALGIVQEVSGALANIVNTFREFTDTQQNLNLLRNVLATIADVLAVIAPIAVSVFQGLLTGVNAVLAPIRFIADLLRRAFDLKDEVKVVGAVLKYLTAIVVASFFIDKIWKAGAMLKALLLAGGAAQRFLFSLAAQVGVVVNLNKNLSITSLITTIISQKMTAVAIKTALATAGISLLVTALVAGIGILLSKTDAWKRAMDKLFPSIGGINEGMDKLGNTTRGALKDIGDIRAEFKDIQESVKKLNEEVRLEQALSGVSDSAKALLELYAKRQIAIEDITKLEREGIAAAKEKLEIIRKQKEEIIAYYEANKAQRDAGFGGRVEAQKIKLLAEEAKQQTRIALLEQDREEKIKGTEEYFATQLNLEKAKYEIIKKTRSLEIDGIEALAAGTAEQERARGAAFADLVIAESKLAVLKEQVIVQEAVAKKTQDGLDDAIKQQKEIIKTAGDSETRLKEAQAALASIKPVEISATIDVDKLEKELLGIKLRTGAGPLSKDKIEERDKRRKELESQIAALRSEGAQADVAGAKEAYDNQIKAAQAKVDAATFEYEQSKETSAQALKDIDVLNDRKKQEATKAAIAELKAATEKAKLQRDLIKAQLAASELFTSGVRLGIIQFQESVGTFAENIAGVVNSSLSSLASTVAGVFKDAIDPRKDVDLKTAFGEFFLNLAGDFVQAITSQLIAKSITSLGFDVAGNATLITSQSALTTAIIANTAAQGAGAGASGAGALAGLAGSAGGAAIGGGAVDSGAKASGSFFAGIMTNPLVYAILIGLIIAMLASAFSKGGLVKGFAKGGKVKGYADGGGIPRPAHIPSSDTVPAWLTPGEYVLPVSLVKELGVGFLEKLRTGVISPDSFRAASSHLTGAAAGIRGYAAGGSVANTPSSAQRGQQTIILPVMPANDTTIDQMLTGGRKAFDRKVNQSPRIGDPNASRAW